MKKRFIMILGSLIGLGFVYFILSSQLRGCIELAPWYVQLRILILGR